MDLLVGATNNLSRLLTKQNACAVVSSGTTLWWGSVAMRFCTAQDGQLLSADDHSVRCPRMELFLAKSSTLEAATEPLPKILSRRAFSVVRYEDPCGRDGRSKTLSLQR